MRAWDYSRTRFPTSGHSYPVASCRETQLSFAEVLDAARFQGKGIRQEANQDENDIYI